jgi:SAM-dependent methyltransferase
MNMWNERYSDAFSAYGTEPNDFLTEVANAIPTGPVLCLAEGEGRNAVFLAQRGYHVTAMDLSEVGLANARALAAERGVRIETQVADLAGFDLGDSKWTGIFAIWAHLPSNLRRSVHARCVRALVPGGVFVLEAYTPLQLTEGREGGPKDPDMLMSASALRDELVGLTFERCEELEREVQEGLYHRGVSSTVQVLARKP